MGRAVCSCQHLCLALQVAAKFMLEAHVAHPRPAIVAMRSAWQVTVAVAQVESAYREEVSAAEAGTIPQSAVGVSILEIDGIYAVVVAQLANSTDLEHGVRTALRSRYGLTSNTTVASIAPMVVARLHYPPYAPPLTPPPALPPPIHPPSQPPSPIPSPPPPSYPPPSSPPSPPPPFPPPAAPPMAPPRSSRSLSSSAMALFVLLGCLAYILLVCVRRARRRRLAARGLAPARRRQVGRDAFGDGDDEDDDLPPGIVLAVQARKAGTGGGYKGGAVPTKYLPAKQAAFRAHHQYVPNKAAASRSKAARWTRA